jgi:hypothetical protein
MQYQSDQVSDLVMEAAEIDRGKQRWLVGIAQRLHLPTGHGLLSKLAFSALVAQQPSLVWNHSIRSHLAPLGGAELLHSRRDCADKSH